MMLLHAVQLAADLYLKKAYPAGPPATVLARSKTLLQFNSDQGLMNWDALEHENNRYSLRLGNESYPHMKLVFLVKDNCNLFYVDAHDSHFPVDKNTPGYQRLVSLRKVNNSLKKSIETTWLSENLPVFGGKIDLSSCKSEECPLNVLALDDEPQILDMLCMCGASIGSKLICATTVKQAIETIEKAIPDVVLCDIMMPEESGYELVACIGRNHPDLPVFYITGLNIEKVDTKGVDGVLQKPFTVKDLGDVLKGVARQKGSKNKDSQPET